MEEVFNIKTSLEKENKEYCDLFKQKKNKTKILNFFLNQKNENLAFINKNMEMRVEKLNNIINENNSALQNNQEELIKLNHLRNSILSIELDIKN